eukprot:1487137-Prymnesium_polylepis.1
MAHVRSAPEGGASHDPVLFVPTRISSHSSLRGACPRALLVARSNSNAPMDRPSVREAAMLEFERHVAKARSQVPRPRGMRARGAPDRTAPS